LVERSAQGQNQANETDQSPCLGVESAPALTLVFDGALRDGKQRRNTVLVRITCTESNLSQRPRVSSALRVSRSHRADGQFGQ
jgi:hypothetical protein